MCFIHWADAQITGHDFPTSKWTNWNGLNSNSVSDMEEDSKGIIWVSTDEGIYMHKGDRFININTLVENSPFDDPIKVYDIYIDKNDWLWIGTVENGLMRYDIKKNTIRIFTFKINGKDNISNLRIYGLHSLNDSIFRFTSHSHGFINYNIHQDSFRLVTLYTDTTELERLDGFQLMARPIADHKSNFIENWYSTLTGIIQYVPQLDSFIYYQGQDHIRIRDAVMDKDSTIWGVTYGQGLYSFDITTKKIQNYRCSPGEDWNHPCMTGASLTIYNDSTLLIDSRGMLTYFNKNQNSFIPFDHIMKNGQWPESTIKMKWINDALWLGSYSSGIYRHNKHTQGVRSFSTLGYMDEVIYDSKNKRYLSTSTPDILSFHSEDSFEEIRMFDYIQDDSYIEGATIDQKGNIWVLTREQIYLFNELDKSFTNYFENILEPIRLDITFREIGTHPDGDIWVASHDGTIFVFDPVTLHYEIYGSSNQGSHPLEFSYRSILEGFSVDGFAWFSAQQGFFGIDHKNKKYIFNKNIIDSKTKELLTIYSPSFGISQKNIICFGSMLHELYTIHRDSIVNGAAHPIELDPLIPNISVNDIEIDADNVIWVATKKGIIKIDQDKNETSVFGDSQMLSSSDGLIIQEGKYPIVTSGRSIHIIDPDTIKELIGEPNIQLLGVELDSKEIKDSNGNRIRTGGKIKLGPNDEYLRIQFNDFNYTSYKPKSYAIKIEGLHNEWIDLKKRTEYGFSGLKSGHTKIWIKSKLEFSTSYSQPILLLQMDVTPPLTQRKSFWAFCMGTLLLLFYLGYRVRLNQLKEKQALMIAFNKKLAETEMKALRAQMNPHFLFNVLNAIKLNVQKNQQEDAIDFITDFSKLIRSVLQNSGKKRITLKEELNTLELYIKIERKRFSTAFGFEFVIDPKINTNLITIPPMLLQPYVENAIWHGILHKSENNGIISIQVQQNHAEIIIEIVDNGIGREKANQLKLKTAQRKKSMGMQITKDRMAINNMVSNDQIKVEIIDLYTDQNQSNGTKVIVKINQYTK